MKAKFKAFTLVELIIVMAILTILMAAIINMFRPIRATYVDSTLYEARRTTQNGIVQYIAESVRYATDLGIYNEDDIADAVDEFADNYCRKYSSADKDDVIAAAEVIIIDNTATIASGEVRNSPYSFNGQNYMGRILRRKNVGDDDLNETLGDGCRLALGEAYYGTSSYAIKISKPDEITDGLTGTELTDELADWSADEGILINVASTIDYGNSGLQRTEGIVDTATGNYNEDVVSTEGLVLCPNIAKLGGVFDVMKDAPPAGGGAGGGGGAPAPPPAGGEGASSNGDGVYINGVMSDDTVGDYVGAGGGGGGGGGGGAGGGGASYTDNVEYTEVVAPNSKIYIVFLNDKV